jgi:hypothetical protein
MCSCVSTPIMAAMVLDASHMFDPMKVAQSPAPVDVDVAMRAVFDDHDCGWTVRIYNTIQEIQVIAPPKRQVYPGAPLRGPDLSLNMHSQQSMNYTCTPVDDDTDPDADVIIRWGVRRHRTLYHSLNVEIPPNIVGRAQSTAAR